MADKDAMIRDSARVKLEVVAVALEGEEAVSDAVERLFSQPVDAVCLVVGLGPSLPTIISGPGWPRCPCSGFAQIMSGRSCRGSPRRRGRGRRGGSRDLPCSGSGEKPGLLPFSRLIDTNTFVNPGDRSATGDPSPSGCPPECEGRGNGPRRTGPMIRFVPIPTALAKMSLAKGDLPRRARTDQVADVVAGLLPLTVGPFVGVFQGLRRRQRVLLVQVARLLPLLLFRKSFRGKRGSCASRPLSFSAERFETTRPVP